MLFRTSTTGCVTIMIGQWEALLLPKSIQCLCVDESFLMSNAFKCCIIPKAIQSLNKELIQADPHSTKGFVCFPLFVRSKKMKIPSGGGFGNGYYNHDMSIISYLSDSDDQSDDFDSPTLDGDFSEYMWMENQEEFDQQVIKQLEEEALMEQCIEAMLEEEAEVYINLQNQVTNALRPDISCQTWNPEDLSSSNIVQSMGSLHLADDLAKKSTLNPNAREFVPQQRTSQAVSIEGKV